MPGLAVVAARHRPPARRRAPRARSRRRAGARAPRGRSACSRAPASRSRRPRPRARARRRRPPGTSTRPRRPSWPASDVAGDDREGHAKARTTSPGLPSCTVAQTPMRASSSRSAAGRARQQPERAVVPGDDLGRSRQARRVGGLERAHRVVVADRQDRDHRLVDLADQAHVGVHGGVAGRVDRRHVRPLDHEAGRIAERRAVRRARGVHRVRHRHVQAGDLDRAALVEADGLRSRPGAQPARELRDTSATGAECCLETAAASPA